ncbi:asparagine synthase-related protein [Streptoverticillium reticulum]|uniref:asparagine synthase-related protein n=1 Tax=Streptoverticillium reticulum TaxID=1433415 RepID=UPI0039BF4D10
MPLTGHLLVFPDSPGGAWARKKVPFTLPQDAVHPSGRPWLAGCWAADDLVVAGAGPVRVAVFGTPGTVDREQLGAAAARIRCPQDLDRLARELPGSSHLVASVHGHVRFQGTVTGTRCVFTSRFEGVPVASDRAWLLARLTRAEPDEQLLAARVTTTEFISPLTERSWWRGVEQVEPGSCLLLTGDGASRTQRWWTPPEPVLPLAAGTWRVREALREAVAVRRPVHGRLSADLSGGMDSTSLCFLAAEHTPGLLTFRWTGGSPIDDDANHAARAAGLLERAEHLVVPPGEAPPVFAPPYALADAEAPPRLTRGLNLIRYGARRVAGRGARLHLAGHGADELFCGSPAYLHTLVRRRPVTALRQARVHRALRRWELLPTLAGLAGREDLGTWWRRYAVRLGAVGPSARPAAPPLGWGEMAPAAPWATGDAITASKRLLRTVADEAGPLAADRGQHRALVLLRASAASARDHAREYAAQGLRLELPYLDDRVVEAGLAIRTYERYTPWRFKPVLADALRGDVPDFVLDRYTKGHHDDTVQQDLQRSLPFLLDLFDGSELAARGLVDTGRLRTALLTPPEAGSDALLPALEAALGAELWLRAPAGTHGTGFGEAA